MARPVAIVITVLAMPSRASLALRRNGHLGSSHCTGPNVCIRVTATRPGATDMGAEWSLTGTVPNVLSPPRQPFCTACDPSIQLGQDSVPLQYRSQ